MVLAGTEPDAGIGTVVAASAARFISLTSVIILYIGRWRVGDSPMPRGQKTRKPAARTGPSFHARALQFVKDWGGVATVLIAILYTFPFDAAARFVSWRDQSRVDARRALAEVASLYAEEVSSVEKIQDLRNKTFLANTYNMRIYNILTANKNVINSAADRLLASELYMVGSLYALAGLTNVALPYYDLALKKSVNEGEKATIYREKGNALYLAGPEQDPAKARSAYQEAIKIAAHLPYAKPSYSSYVAELGTFELAFGDWKCGQDLTAYALSLLDLATVREPAASQTAAYFRSYTQAMTRGAEQAGRGCPYQIEFLPSKMDTLTNATAPH